MFSLFKNRNFALLYTGNFVSQIGNVFFNFAVGWFILTLTESPMLAGIYIGLSGVVRILSLSFAGVFVDRLNKVRILYITDFIRGFTVLIGGFIIFVVSDGALMLGLLYAIAVILALNGAFFNPAMMALRPVIVSGDELARANAFFSFIQSIQSIIGILAAGLLYSVLGIELIFIVNGLSFILSGVSEMFIRVKPSQAKCSPGVKRRFSEDFKEGFDYLLNKTGLMHLMMAALMLNFAFAPMYANVFPYVFNLVLDKAPIHLSFVQIVGSVGMLLGGLLVAYIGKTLVIRRAMRQGLTATTIGFFITAVLLMTVTSGSMRYETFIFFLLPTMFLTSVANVYVNVPFHTGILKAIDEYVRGRVFGIMDTVSQAMVPLAVLLAGFILEYGSLNVLMIGAMLIIVVPYYIVMASQKTNELLHSLT